MPSRDVNAAARLAEASWRRDKKTNRGSLSELPYKKVGPVSVFGRAR